MQVSNMLLLECAFRIKLCGIINKIMVIIIIFFYDTSIEVFNLANFFYNLPHVL